ncbi:MAG TPA: response regulator [Steroidobacteraceae bacterium]|jgi:chemosensory pili system protein ChpA (sensor histidine kinase/response regulator)|nr:response regulator [Steroidobacteraceae bacterium]
MRGHDLLTALADELQGLAPELASAYDSGSSGEPATIAHADNSYVTSVTRLSEAAGYMGLGGVQRIAACVLTNLQHLDADDQDARVLVRPFFTDWAQLLEAHLRNASASGPVDSLIAHFGGGWVPLPLDEGALQELRAELSAASGIGAALDETEQAAPEALVAADLVLDVSHDVDGALLDAFLHDSPPQAAEVTQSLQGWIANPAHTELLRNAKRAAHTLKGSANILGIRGVAKLAHRLEDILEICETESAAPSSLRAKALMAAADCLEQMVATVAGEDSAPENVLDVVAQLDAARDSNNSVLDAASDNDASDTVRQHALEASVAPVQQAAPTIAPARAAPVATTRVPTALLDNLVRMVGEITIKVGELEQELKSTAGHSRQLVEQDRSIQKRLFELENSVDIRGVAARHKLHAVETAHPDFDSLEMDQYNEVQSLTRALIEETTDARDLGIGLKDELAGLAGILHQQQRLMRELQHLTSQTRMAPVETIVPRLQRNVRQTAAATNKQASLVVAGNDILVDADVLNQLIDPLLHILRNAVDHGLESPEERETCGKPRAGTIKLTVSRRGQVVTVQVADDGRGLNLDDIRAKAVERGLLAAEATPSDAEIARLTLLPGFSTRDAVTEISGRGVGLDVVATRLRSLSGAIDIRSEAGRGLTIELRFQASLVATHALFVRDGGQVFGIASHTVRRAIPAVAVELVRENGALFALVDETRYPAHELGALTGMRPAANPDRRNLVLVDSESGPIAVLVDAVLDASELVTRPTGSLLKRIPGVAGIGLLGNGSVIPLLDVAELARSPRDHALRAAAEARSYAKELRRSRVLVVDDSMSVRRAVATLLEDQGYEVAQARDGLEAVKAMEAARPDVLLTDLEMPNMNGLELTAHIRSRADLANLPVIMITSRSMDKHRRQALSSGVNVYLTKPYTDQELLQHVAQAVTGRVEKRAAAG